MPLCIEDDQGRVVWWANRIDPYGVVDLQPGAELEYNLRWPGHYHDPETGLHYNRYRYYDPALGRYLQTDPIGYSGSPTNLFAYCANPLVSVDILGLTHPANAEPPAEGPENQSQKHATNPDGDAPPPKSLAEMSDAELRAHVEARAKALGDAYREASPSAAKRTTLSVGVLETGGDPRTRRVVVTTSADGPSQTLHKSVTDAMLPSEHAMVPARPRVLRVNERDNPAYVKPPEGTKPNPQSNPKRISDPALEDPKTGELTTPYVKADKTGQPIEGTRHHAEQRMETEAGENGEKVLAQAPTRECCPGCQQVLGEKGLAKVPTSLQGKPPG
jgi:RHS repeat-associated protein